MNDAALFSPADIRVIRRYVQTKYAHLSGEKQAEIVAAAVKMTVQRRMPELPADLQSQIADKVIRRCLVEARRAIVPADVLDVCASHLMHDPQLKARVASSIQSWLQKHEPGQWNEEKPAARLGEATGNNFDDSGKRAKQESSRARSGPDSNNGASANGSRDEQGIAVGASEPQILKTSAAGNGIVQGTAVSEGAFNSTGSSESAVTRQGQAHHSTDDNRQSMASIAGDLATRQRRFSGIAAVPKFVWALALMLLFGGITAAAMAERQPAPEPVQYVAPSFQPPPPESPPPSPDVGMPDMLRYQEIDKETIQAYLISRDSMLAQEPYFSAIVDSGREHDVHPLLLFAITGQEQGFVPKSSKHAERIANNPFNVFQSWELFNTNIHESADIAARTVARRGAKRPEGVDPFVWLNETYAEDPNWAQGVKLIFMKLNSLERDAMPAMSTGGNQP